jgi:hypothetical protein
MSSKPRTIWANYAAFFHDISEIEIDPCKAKDGTDMIDIRFKNSSHQGGVITLFLDEGCRLQWPLKAQKKKKGDWFPTKIRFVMKKKTKKD